jgi:hypothetical protein
VSAYLSVMWGIVSMNIVLMFVCLFLSFIHAEMSPSHLQSPHFSQSKSTRANLLRQ